MQQASQSPHVVFPELASAIALSQGLSGLYHDRCCLACRHLRWYKPKVEGFDSPLWDIAVAALLKARRAALWEARVE